MLGLRRLYTNCSEMFETPYVKALKTVGCDCCSDDLPLTKNNLDKAIKEAEEWLEFLNTLKTEKKYE